MSSMRIAGLSRRVRPMDSYRMGAASPRYSGPHLHVSCGVDRVCQRAFGAIGMKVHLGLPARAENTVGLPLVSARTNGQYSRLSSHVADVAVGSPR